jgi:predicted dehydrogenase
VLGPTGVDLSAGATLVFDDGILARVACSIQADLESSLRVYGSTGTITVPSPWLPGRIGSRGAILVEGRDAGTRTIDIPLDADVYTIEVETVNGFVVAGQRSSEAMTWDESLANMRTLDRWRAGAGTATPTSMTADAPPTG